MNIGSIICKLRQKKGYTQEKLAGLLGITTGAVSKWESGNAYPDITLIPRLADIFGVSIDYLFERKDILDKSVEEIVTEVKGYSPEKSIEVLTAALERYPNNTRLTYELAWCKAMAAKEQGPDSELMKETEKLFETLTRISDDDEISAHSFDRLSKISFLRQDYEKALYYNSKIMPPNGLYPRSEYAIIKLCQQDNDDALHTAKETLYRSIYEYSNTLSWVLGYYHRHNMLTDALDEVSRAIKLFELFEQSGYYLQDLSIYYESSAVIHALRKEYDEALDDLEASYKYALKCDTVKSNEKYKLFGNIADEENVVYNERKDMLAALLSSERTKIYAPIKDTKRYKDIIKALEEA